SSVQHGWRSVTGPLTILAAWECVRCTLAVDRPYEAYRRPYTKDRPEPWRSGKTVGSVDRRNSTQAWRSRRARYMCGVQRKRAPGLPIRKLIALLGDARRTCRPHGVGLGGRLCALGPEATGKHQGACGGRDEHEQGEHVVVADD